MISTNERPSIPVGAIKVGLRKPMDANSVVHQPVLLEEAMEALAVYSGGRYVDCTVGGGGHTEAILDRCLPGGHVLAIDTDSEAIDAAHLRLNRFQPDLTLTHGSYTDLGEIINSNRFGPADGVIFDLGLSSLQLEASGRGFSFRRNEPLDMRFNSSGGGTTAADIVNEYSEKELTRLLRSYGEEPRARSIARAMVQHRPFDSAAHLAVVVTEVTRSSRGGIHPATRTFQALRIATNKELDNLQIGLKQAMDALKPGGRLAVISYHSLEDRIVKDAFRTESKGCICPTEVLQCVCNHVARLRTITRKIITPTFNEKVRNPRSRSARMRVAEHLQVKTL